MSHIPMEIGVRMGAKVASICGMDHRVTLIQLLPPMAWQSMVN